MVNKMVAGTIPVPSAASIEVVALVADGRWTVLRIALVVVVASCLGCSTSSPSPPPIDGPNNAVAEAASGEVVDSSSSNSVDKSPAASATKELESLGVQLRSNTKSRNIESVDFSKIEINDQMASQVAELDSVVQLVLRQSAMTDQGWSSLSQLKSLQHLDLRECPINSPQLLKVVGSMHQLKSFRLSGKAGNCSVDDAGLECLQKLANLRLLSLDGVKVGDVGLKHIGEHTKLTELYLSETLITDATLSQFTSLRELKKLRLAQTAVTASGFVQLTSLPIEELDVSQCANIDDAGCVELGKLTTLKRLNLWSDPVGDVGLQHLGKLSRLQWLNLDNTKITDAGLPWLQGLPELGFLHLGSTVVSDNGLPSLTMLKSLKQLVVTRTQVTQAGVDALQKLMPAVDIQLKYVAGQ
jgi:Leucine-rich repeat (LRR) protein